MDHTPCVLRCDRAVPSVGALIKPVGALPQDTVLLILVGESLQLKLDADSAQQLKIRWGAMDLNLPEAIWGREQHSLIAEKK